MVEEDTSVLERNPFTPTFGIAPPYLADREKYIRDFTTALRSGVGDPHLVTLVTGPRGQGKTALLNVMRDTARNEGWAVVSESATPGLLSRLVSAELPREHARLLGQAQGRPSSVGINLFGAGASVAWDNPGAAQAQLRQLIEELSSNTASKGLLITVDELHKGELDDLVQITATVQLAMGQKRNVGFIATGLEGPITELLNNPSTTFLRRAARIELGPLSERGASEALQIPIQKNARSIEPDALGHAVRATYGYSYMTQLIGYHAWRVDPANAVITLEHVNTALPLALENAGRSVYSPALKELSPQGRAFIRVLAANNGTASLKLLETELETSYRNVQYLRGQLIDEQIIMPTERGVVALALPGLGAFVRNNPEVVESHARSATDAWTFDPYDAGALGQTPTLGDEGPSL
jgi:hypothetical protein